MKIDNYGCVILETGDYRGDIGDSCANTGRLLIFEPLYYQADANFARLAPFMPDGGFVRHPAMPQPYDFTDFSCDQGNYLLMAADLVNIPFAMSARKRFKAMGFKPAPGKWPTPSFVFLVMDWTHVVAFCSLVQMLFNALPFRWGDDTAAKSHWYSFFWRFESSSTSTVSYMTTYTSAIYYKRMGINWFGWIFKHFAKNYLTKALPYFADADSNSKWYADLMEKASI